MKPANQPVTQVDRLISIKPDPILEIFWERRNTSLSDPSINQHL